VSNNSDSEFQIDKTNNLMEIDYYRVIVGGVMAITVVGLSEVLGHSQLGENIGPRVILRIGTAGTEEQYLKGSLLLYLVTLGIASMVAILLFLLRHRLEQESTTAHSILSKDRVYEYTMLVLTAGTMLSGTLAIATRLAAIHTWYAQTLFWIVVIVVVGGVLVGGFVGSRIKRAGAAVPKQQAFTDVPDPTNGSFGITMIAVAVIAVVGLLGNLIKRE
jgi:hypothetical protein